MRVGSARSARQMRHTSRSGSLHAVQVKSLFGSLLGAARLIWQRHRWSVPLSLVSATFFARLASEVSEHELDAFDRGMQRLVDGWRGSFDTPMVFMTDAGSFLPVIAFTSAVLVVLASSRRKREARHLLFSALGCLLLNVLLKLLFHRARPDAEPPYLLPRPTSLSFPSGHTMGNAGVVGSLVVIIRGARPARLVWVAAAIIGALWVGGVALSRVYLGAHYPSDVLGGLLAAAAWLSAVTGWLYPRLLPHERTTLGPSLERSERS
jgi:undecaprenyl-diphosphatase